MSIQQKKAEILKHALRIVPFDGWSNQTMEQASEKAGLDRDACYLLFKNGVQDLVDLYAHDLDDKMVEHAKKQDVFSITKRVQYALIERIKLLSKNKATAKRTSSFLLMPYNYHFSAGLVWRTADRIWKDIIQDESIDFNYYTKRTLLCGIYTSSIIYYLGDDNITLQNTESFIERRLADVASLGKVIGKITRKQ